MKGWTNFECYFSPIRPLFLEDLQARPSDEGGEINSVISDFVKEMTWSHETIHTWIPAPTYTCQHTEHIMQNVSTGHLPLISLIHFRVSRY